MHQVYAAHGWVLAEDHIHFTLGKQAHHLKQLTEGLDAYTNLVDQKLKKNASSQQSSSQQITYLREFINMFHQYTEQEWNSSNGAPCLPLPLIESQATRVLLGAPQDSPTSQDWIPASHLSLDAPPANNARWFALEREVVETFHSLNSMTFKPNLQLLTNDTPNTDSPIVPVNEPVLVEIIMINPLSLNLVISDVRLVFTFEPAEGDEPNDATVKHSTHPEFILAAGAQEPVRLELIPSSPGRILVRGVIYKLSLPPDASAASSGSSSAPVVIEGQQKIEVKGPRLNNTSTEKCSAVYANDKRLDITVLPAMSRLSVSFHDIPQIMSCGELCSTDAVITNIGPCPISKLKLAVSDPNHMYMEIKDLSLPKKHVCVLREKEAADSKITNRLTSLPLENGTLNSGESIQAKLWLHAPMSPGAFEVELLFYYDSAGVVGKKK